MKRMKLIERRGRVDRGRASRVTKGPVNIAVEFGLLDEPTGISN